jgi:hypothetical protein
MVPSKDTIEQCVSANAKKLQCPVANFPLFLLFGRINLVFSLMLYLDLLGACLQHV